MEGEGWLSFYECPAEPANHKFPAHQSVRLHKLPELRSAAWVPERLKALRGSKDLVPFTRKLAGRGKERDEKG